MSITQLPRDVIEKLRSSVLIGSLNDVACGLVTNSLDSSATKINVLVDYSRGNCTVEDNGSGILPGEFRAEGGLGKLHHTSRFPASCASHGRNGDFLASLSTFSLLAITSHHQGNISHNTLIMHNGAVLQRQLPSSPEQRFHTFDHGTRVSVRDIFGSMPVRVKQRTALVSVKSNVDKEWARLVYDIVALAMAWPPETSILIRDNMSQQEIRLRSPSFSQLSVRISRLLTQASLIDANESDSWVHVSASSRDFTVSGSIAKVPIATRRCQFISLGIQPMPNDHGTNALYEEVNLVFANSDFGSVEDDGLAQGDKGESILHKGPRKLRKGIERWPMFYLQVLQPSYTEPQTLDHLFEARQSDLTTIVDLLKAVCYSFLRKHHWQPRKVHISYEASVFSTSVKRGRSSRPAKRKASSTISSSRSSSYEAGRINSPFDDWHLVKSGRPTSSTNPKPRQSHTGGLSEESLMPLVGEGGKLLRKPFGDPSPVSKDLPKDWSPPGGIARHRSAEDGTATTSEKHSTVSLPSKAPPGPSKRLRVLESRPKSDQSPWLQDVVKSWKNPVFETAQPRIPCVNEESSHCEHGTNETVNFDSASLDLNGRLSRTALARAEVISQVDRKFVLVKMPLHNAKQDECTGSSALVMIDQHAADERCRLEALMAEYFTENPTTGRVIPITGALEPPRVYEISSREGDILQQLRQHFATWGVAYEVHASEAEGQPAMKVVISALPPSILERCRSEPRVLIDLLRREIWRREEGPVLGIRDLDYSAGKHWTAYFHGCPRGILELLHSRSCRSAIMFNDVLSRNECEQLIMRLSACSFPFQCAHGRPSMAPLLELGSSHSSRGWNEGGLKGTGFWKAAEE